MTTRGGVWPFCVNNGPKKNCRASRDCPVAEGGFMVSKMWVLMAYATGELSVDEDKSAMVT